MADTKLSALTALAVTPADTDEFYINDGGVSKRVTYATIKAAFADAAALTALYTDTDEPTGFVDPTAIGVAYDDLLPHSRRTMDHHLMATLDDDRAHTRSMSSRLTRIEVG